MRRFLPTLFLLAALPAAAGAVDVTTCGQTVPPDEVGVLQADLTGCGANDVAVAIADRGKLLLNGHAIASGAIGVQCIGRRCSVDGPGEIRDVSLFGILISKKHGRLRVRDAVVRDSGQIGIASLGSRGRVKLERVTVAGNRSGVETTTNGAVSGKDVEVVGNLQWGVVAGRDLHFTRLTVVDTGLGQPQPGDGLVCFWCGGTLRASSVTGSTGKDILTFRKPELARSTCGTSGSPYDPERTWSVCAND